jgi:hypothetical protein
VPTISPDSLRCTIVPCNVTFSVCHLLDRLNVKILIKHPGCNNSDDDNGGGDDDNNDGGGGGGGGDDDDDDNNNSVKAHLLVKFVLNTGIFLCRHLANLGEYYKTNRVY